MAFKRPVHWLEWSEKDSKVHFKVALTIWQVTVSIFSLNFFNRNFLPQILNDQKRTTKLRGRSLTIWQVTIWDEGNNFRRHVSHLAINAYSQEHVDLDNHRSPCHWLTCPPGLLGTQGWAKLSWRWPKIEIELWQRNENHCFQEVHQKQNYSTKVWRY